MQHKRGEGPQKRETRTMQHRSQKLKTTALCGIANTLKHNVYV